MKEFKLGVTYQVCGYLYVTAETKDEAIGKAYGCHWSEVRAKKYIDGSWHVDENDITEIDYEAEERVALEFWTHIRDEARREWRSWANDYPEGKNCAEMHRRRERFLQWFCAKYRGVWDGASSIATFHSEQGVCEIYVNNLWVEDERDPEVRMGSTIWHQRPDGSYKKEVLLLSLENYEPTIETEKEVK